MIPRPRMTLPVWLALTVVMSAYVFRSAIMRGGDFTLDLPVDAVALAAVVAGAGLVGLARHRHGNGSGADDVGDNGSGDE